METDFFEVFSSAKDVEKLEWLVAEGADMNVKDAKHGGTVVMNIVSASTSPDASINELEAIKRVRNLAAFGADVNIRNNGGMSPLEIVVMSGQKEMVKCLAALGASINAETNDGRTALSIAESLGDVKSAVNWLRANGAK